METLLPLFALIGLSIGLLIFIGVTRRNRGLLHNWAERLGYSIVYEEERWRLHGTWPLQSLFYVTVEKDGKRRKAWVWCGGLFGPNKVDFQWDGSPTSTDFDFQ